MTRLCLVTGGVGFIGSHLVEALTFRGWTVRVLDNLCTGRRDNLAPVQPAPQLVEGDLSDAPTVERTMGGVEVVFHLTALPSVPRSVADPVASHHVCATRTLHVLNAARLQPESRVAYAASSSAYGGRQDAAGQSEDMPIQPRSPYAAAKLAGELYAQAFVTTIGLETVCLRFFNGCAPRQPWDSPYAGVIPRFIASLANIERARRELGYEPEVSFREGLQRTVAWVLGRTA